MTPRGNRHRKPYNPHYPGNSHRNPITQHCKLPWQQPINLYDPILHITAPLGNSYTKLYDPLLCITAPLGNGHRKFYDPVLHNITEPLETATENSMTQ